MKKQFVRIVGFFMSFLGLKKIETTTQNLNLVTTGPEIAPPATLQQPMITNQKPAQLVPRFIYNRRNRGRLVKKDGTGRISVDVIRTDGDILSVRRRGKPHAPVTRVHTTDRVSLVA